MFSPQLFSDLEQQIREIDHKYNNKLDLILKELQHMATDLSDLTAEVTNNTNVTASVLSLIQNIEAELTAAGTDPAALAALVNTLKSNDAALAAAVTANTPASTATLTPAKTS